MEKYKISIVIPCYNDAKYIQQAVNSALNQTYDYTEVIVVDDGSDEKTKKILSELEPKITKLITQENQGQSNARNVGIKVSQGELILVLDSDDFFEPTFCEEAVAIFNRDSTLKIVTCQAMLHFSDNRKRIYIPKGGDIKSFMHSNQALGTSMFKKKDWELVDGYDESMRSGLEDWEFFIHLLKNGGSCYVIPKVLYNYRKRNDSTTSKAFPVKFDLLKYVYIKHKELYKDDIENFIEVFSISLKRLENEKLKIFNSVDYKIGRIVLKPIRFMKRIYYNFKIF